MDWWFLSMLESRVWARKLYIYFRLDNHRSWHERSKIQLQWSVSRWVPSWNGCIWPATWEELPGMVGQASQTPSLWITHHLYAWIMRGKNSVKSVKWQMDCTFDSSTRWMYWFSFGYWSRCKAFPKGLTFHGIFSGDRDLIYPLSFLTIVSSIQALSLSRYISPFLSV